MKVFTGKDMFLLSMTLFCAYKAGLLEPVGTAPINNWWMPTTFFVFWLVLNQFKK